MKNTQMRQGVSQANRVIRKLKLDKPLEEDISAAVGEIGELLGMEDVSVDEKSGVLRLAYDADRLSIEGIEAVLFQHGIDLSGDWWTRLKVNQYRFVDQNIKDNAAYVPSCCNKIPPGAGSK